MEKVYLLGLMAVDMKDNMLTIRNKALASLYSKMEDAIKENGKMVSNMEKAFFGRKMPQDRASGCKDSEFNGLMKENKMRLELFHDKNGLNSIYIIIVC